ncbi:unnamed protein product, partial [Phaeothamnion confervicola]
MAIAGRSGTGKPERICILGGGFGGLYTALRLSQLPWGPQAKPDITLVDKRDKFTFLPLLYELACGTAQLSEVAAPYPELLAGTGVRFVQGDVTAVNLDACTATVAGAAKSPFLYDKLVIALGAEPAMMAIPGAAENAIPFYTSEDAYRLRKELRRLQASSQPTVRIVVIGASYGGVELACNLVATLGRDRARITIVDRNAAALRDAADANRGAGLSRLAAAGIELLCSTDVLEVRPDGVVTKPLLASAADGLPAAGMTGAGAEPWAEPKLTLQADLVLWTAGSRPSAALAALSLKRDARGRIITDARLCVPGTDNAVYALGDSACVAGAETLPATAQAALQQSDYVAWNLWAARRGRDQLDFKFLDLGQLLTLGPQDGAVTTLGERLKFDGPAAGLARRLVYAARMPTNAQRARAAVGLAS